MSNNECGYDPKWLRTIMSDKKQSGKIGDLAQQVQDLQEMHDEVMGVLSEIIATIGSPRNDDCRISELREFLTRTYPGYFGEAEESSHDQ